MRSLGGIRLVIVNGCSLTHGDEHEAPDETSWGPVLARRISTPCVNLASDGGSNRRLVRTAVAQVDVLTAWHGVQPRETLFLAMWTKLNRSEVYAGEPDPYPGLSDAFVDRDWHRILPWLLGRSDRPSVAWYRYLQHDVGDRLDFLLGWVLLQAWLRQRGYRHGFLWAFDPDPTAFRGGPEFTAQIDFRRVIGADDGGFGGPSLYSIGRMLGDLGRRNHPLERSRDYYVHNVLYPWLEVACDRDAL
jgi:hypothetical protein